MPKKPPRKPQPAPSQGLQRIPQPEPSARTLVERRVTVKMNEFIRAYEAQCGNISAACKAVGISRRAYYRWSEGNLPIYRQFRRKLERVRPKARIIDAAQSVLLHHLEQKDLDAAKFTLRTQGKEDGWTDKLSETVDLLGKLVIIFNRFAASRPDATIEDKARWVNVIAAKSRVEPTELAKRVGLNAG